MQSLCHLTLWTKDKLPNLQATVGNLLHKAQIPNSTHLIQNGLPVAPPGSLVLAMGKNALMMLQQCSLVPKGRSIASLRHKLYDLPCGAKCMITYDADIKEIDYGLYVDVQCDVRAAIRYCQTGSLKPDVGEYEYVKDFSAEQQYVEKHYAETGEPVVCSMDLETWGLDPYDPSRHIVSVQLSVREGHSAIVTFDDVESMKDFNGQKKLRSQIEWFLTSPKVRIRGANFKYDQGWLFQKWSIICTNFTMDTTVVGSLLDENRSNDLNTHAKIETSMGGYDDPFNMKWKKDNMPAALKADPEGFKVYAGGDTDACLRVSWQLEDQITDHPDLANFYCTILHPALRAYEQVERVGWYVDRPYYEHLRDELEFEMRRLLKTGKEMVGGRIVAKHTDQKTGELNLQKASLLCDFMFTPMGLNLHPKMNTPSGKGPSTAMEHLKMFEDHPRAGPFVTMLKEYGSTKKTYDTYVVGFLACLRADGRFHPTYFFYSGNQYSQDEDGGTVTGRLSATDPPVQTIPMHTIWAKKIRKAFIAPEGYLICANDYRQGELKIIACLANEEAMIEAYLNDIDLHALTGSSINGYTWEQFEALMQSDPDLAGTIRQGGKVGNFGLVYGMQPAGYMNYARIKYGVHLTPDQAESSHTAFFRKYRRLLQYHKDQIEFAHKHGYVPSPLGRIRHLPLIKSPLWEIKGKAERQSINSPTQSTLSDMTLWATAEMKRRGMLKHDPVFGMVHDQGLRYVRENHWEKAAREGREVMENLPFEQVGWKPQLQFTVDTKVGRSLGDLEAV